MQHSKPFSLSVEGVASDFRTAYDYTVFSLFTLLRSKRYGKHNNTSTALRALAARVSTGGC